MATRVNLNDVSALPAGDLTLKVKAKASGYTDSAFSSTVTITKLATPTNPSASGTDVSFDEVQGADKYEFFANGTSIGIYQLPQLSAPTNVSVSGTTATFDEVENAESYEFFVDGTSIGTYTPTQSYTVAISIEQYGESEKTLLEILDGTEASSTLLYDWTSTSGTISQSVTCTSGYLTIRYAGAAEVTSLHGTGGVEHSDSGAAAEYFWQTFAVSGDGSIVGFIEFDD